MRVWGKWLSVRLLGFFVIGVLLLSAMGGCSSLETESRSEAVLQSEVVVDNEASDDDDAVLGGAAPAGNDPVARDFTTVDETVEGFVAENDLNGAALLIVDRDDDIVYEEYWGEFGPDRVSLVASASKTLSVGVLMHLVDEGLLDMNVPISEQTDWGDDEFGITPSQLVSNSSGLVGLFPQPAYGTYLCQFDFNTTTETCAKTVYQTPDDDADVIEPDTDFRYGGAQWQVAGGLAEAVSGKGWNELVQEIYVEPCGLESFGYSNHYALFNSGLDYPAEFDGDVSLLPVTDNPNIEGGLYTTPRDYARLLAMQLQDGRCGDTEVISPESLAFMQTERVKATYGADDDPAYALGWWVTPGERIYDPGAYGAISWLDPEDGHGAILVLEADSIKGRALADELYGPVEEALAGS